MYTHCVLFFVLASIAKKSSVLASDCKVMAQYLALQITLDDRDTHLVDQINTVYIDCPIRVVVISVAVLWYVIGKSRLRMFFGVLLLTDAAASMPDGKDFSWFFSPLSVLSCRCLWTMMTCI